MAQASVLTDVEIRRVFRIIETTRHVERNRLCFTLSIYAGLRVGEIATLTVADVSTQSGDIRREIKLDAHQTKGSKGRTVILSERVRKEIGSFLKTQPKRDHDRAADRIAAQWSPFYQRHTLNVVQRNLRDRGHSNIFTFGKTDFRDTPQ